MSTSGFMLYYNTTGPMSFPAMTPRDVPASARKLGMVVGRSCQRGLSVPVSADIRSTSVSGNFGDGGYGKAIGAIKAAHPDVPLHCFLRMRREPVFRILSLEVLSGVIRVAVEHGEAARGKGTRRAFVLKRDALWKLKVEALVSG